MKFFVSLFAFGAFLLMAHNSNAATTGDVFAAFAQYRTNMSHLISAATDKMLSYKQVLDTSNTSMTQDISIFVKWHQQYSTNLTYYETEGQNQNLSISDCIAIHSFLDTYATTGIQTLNKKLTTFYQSALGEVNSYLNTIKYYGSSSEEGIFTDLVACDDASVCLDNVVKEIASNFTNNQIDLNVRSDIFGFGNSLNTTINTISTSINDYLYDGLRQVVLVYNTGIECLENAGVVIP